MMDEFERAGSRGEFVGRKVKKRKPEMICRDAKKRCK
jgi:hypothetical protein